MPLFSSLTPPAPRTACPPRASAMLLAAGRGTRMRPLTDTCPKPLLVVRGQPLIQWHLQALAKAGITRAVVNTAWLGSQIADALSHTDYISHRNISISYSHEYHDFGYALETAGGIVRALPLLDDVFWVLAADVYAPDFFFSQDALKCFRAGTPLAHLWLVPNPAHHPKGDFGLDGPTDTRDVAQALDLPPADPRPRYTYSTIGLYKKALFRPPWCPIAEGNPQGVCAGLAPLLRAAMAQGKVTAQVWTGAWTDVGTPERLAALNRRSPSSLP